MKEQLKKALEELVLPQIELAVEAGVQAKSDELVEFLAKKLCDAIPSQIDDALMAPLLPELKVHAKKFLLEQAENISDKV